MARSVADEVTSVIMRVNDAWLSGRVDDMTDDFHPDVVVVQPGFEHRAAGRDAVLDSYRDFARGATVHEFATGDIRIDQIGDTAVATVPWAMRYEMEGGEFNERGFDLLVLVCEEARWVIVWRTVIVG